MLIKNINSILILIAVFTDDGRALDFKAFFFKFIVKEEGKITRLDIGQIK